MKAEDWVKTNYEPVRIKSLAEYTNTTCIVIDGEVYEISTGDYNYYIQMKTEESIKKALKSH